MLPNAIRPGVLCCALMVVAGSMTSATLAQAVGPDCISSSHNDVARNGINAAGTILGYSVGSVTCNKGDMPMEAQPSNAIRPLMSQELYRLKTYTDARSGVAYQRLEQIGQGWVKWIAVPGGGTNSTCGTCINSGAFATMGVNCADVYSSGFNSPSGMAKRSQINATTGYFTGTTRGGGTDEAAINTRLQVPVADITNQPADTKYIVESVHLLPHDASYVRPGQTVAINALNNASSQEIALNGGVGTPALAPGGTQQIPAVQRWWQLDPSVTLVTADHDDTPNPDPRWPGTFIRSRFYIGAKVTDLGDGRYRYEYAVYNLNSDRSAGRFSIPLPMSAQITDFSFKHAPYHSGEAISNTPWTFAKAGNRLTFATEDFARNASANAIRWGSLYNFGFTTNVAPSPGVGVIGLFKPGTLSAALATAIPVPTVCVAEVTGDNALSADDVIAYLNGFFGTNLTLADVASLGGGLVPDGQITSDDLIAFLASFFRGCP
jgi:hypothetical protein